MRKEHFVLPACFLTLFMTASVGSAKGQTTPVLRANSVDVDVRDGKNLYKKYWTVSPGLKKDVYYAHRFRTSNRITFITDVDSLSFQVEPGKTYGFIILLAGKDSCYTEISTIRTTYHKTPDQPITRDTLPFALGQDNRIYVQGTINRSEPLRFFFDNGADNTIVFPSAFHKGLRVTFDDSVQNNATGGSQIRQTSNINHLELSKMVWDNEWVMYINKQLGDNADGTIGYDVFQDKIVEINFDEMIMVIHDKPFHIDSSYARFDMNLNGGDVPFIKTSLFIGGSEFPKTLMFDMGATGCLFLNQQYLSKNNLYGKMRVIGNGARSGAGSGSFATRLAVLPKLVIGKFALTDLPINLPLPSAGNADAEELGMDVLKRFNTILDYQNNLIYLRPNRFFSSPYKAFTQTTR